MWLFLSLGGAFAAPGPCGEACRTAVDGLLGRAVPPGDPRGLFVRVQTCIARTGCAGEVAFDDPAWFGRVLAGFVRGYVEGLGEWPRLERECALLTALDGALCVNEMVRYHIETELVDVLLREGCGTPRDWDAVGAVIQGCLAREDTWVARVGAWILPIYRYNARAACEAGG